jgi:hypothetical protein
MTRMIPILPCRSIDEVLDFYRTLGFTVTLRQTRPNPYAAVERDGMHLQFYGMRSHEPGSQFHTCYALLDDADDIDALHTVFRAGLKAAYGRIPLTGIPRIGPVGDMSYGVRQFLLTDPAGNQIRIGKPIADRAEPDPVPRSRLIRALETAVLLVHSKEDPVTAARVLDPVLDEARSAAAPVRVRALVLRADLAVTLDDPDLARRLLAEVRDITLDDGDRATIADELRRAADLTTALP